MKNYTQDETRKLLEQMLGNRFTDGNEIKILRNGDEIFPAMLQAIDQAVERIDFLTYVYWTGEIAERFARALARRAASGVRVRVLLDAFGAKLMDQDLLNDMQDAGVDIRWFRPLGTFRLWRSDKRTHRKILVCDTDIGFTGGVGIADEWEGDARNPNEWRDTHAQLRGPTTTGLRAAFLDNWNEAGEWAFEYNQNETSEVPNGVPMMVVKSSSTIDWTDTATLLRSLIALSQRHCRIVTAYFNPDEKLVELLIDAHRRGVAIEILIPGPHSDSRLSQLAGHIAIERLLCAGIAVWHYQQTMLHSKLIIVDSIVTCIGSANFNHRSNGKDEECCVLTLSKDTAQQLNDQFDHDLTVSNFYSAEAWQSRSRLTRLQERCARLIVEQL